MMIADIARYELMLVLDVAAAGNDFLSIPVVAECVVPEVAISSGLLDLGRCFVNHPYAQVLTVLFTIDSLRFSSLFLITDALDS